MKSGYDKSALFFIGSRGSGMTLLLTRSGFCHSRLDLNLVILDHFFLVLATLKCPLWLLAGCKVLRVLLPFSRVPNAYSQANDPSPPFAMTRGCLFLVGPFESLYTQNLLCSNRGARGRQHCYLGGKWEIDLLQCKNYFNIFYQNYPIYHTFSNTQGLNNDQVALEIEIFGKIT